MNSERSQVGREILVGRFFAENGEKEVKRFCVDGSEVLLHG